MLIKKVVKKILILGKLFKTTVDSMTTKSAYVIALGNHGNKQNCINVDFYTYKEVGNRNIGFGKMI